SYDAEQADDDPQQSDGFFLVAVLVLCHSTHSRSRRTSITDSLTLRRWSGPRDGQSIDAYRRRSQRRAKLEVAADLGDVPEHLFQVTRDGDLFYGISQLAILDPD